MKLVEKHLVRPSKSFFPEIDKLAFLSKNLYNCAIYQCRQAFFAGKKIPSYNRLYHLLKTGIDYKALPSKVAQLVIKQAVKCFDSYFAALQSYRQDSSRFLGKPKLPRFKHKIEGRNVLTYNYQAVSKKALAKGLIHPSGTSFYVPTQHRQVDEVRIVPKEGSYVIEVVYTVEDVLPPVEFAHTKIAGIDIGIDNLACVTSNLPEFQPFIVCGKALKSANRYYNKAKARLQRLLPENRYCSRRISQLTRKRNSKVDYYLHTASRCIVNRLLENQITLLVIGKNDNWKQKVNLGHKTNQKFTAIPHTTFIEKLTYKCQLVGIKVVTVGEAYTSKCSFLDFEPIKKQTVYLGKRVKRGLFKVSSGRVYNCDSNGSLNCIRKRSECSIVLQSKTGDAIASRVGDSVFDRQSIMRLVVSPVRVKPYKASFV